MSKHSTKFLLALTAALIATSILLTPALQGLMEPRFASAPDSLSALRSLLVGVGASLIGATAIIFSVVMLAVQLNFVRIPFGLFRQLSSDIPLLACFAAAFLLGVAIGVAALLPDVTWVAPAVVVSGWCALAALGLFFIAYKRALDLISPAKQMQMVLGKANRSMRRWDKRAVRYAPLLEKRPTPKAKRDIARATFFRMHPHWESEVREASAHVLAFAKRYAEQGEYDVSGIALNGLVAMNGRYIATRGETFFPSNPFFTNPLSAEPFISDTLEKLRRLALSAQGRSDEEQFIQVMTTMADLCATYARIDYGRDLGVELRHSQLAAAYLTGAVEGAARTFGPDVLMEGVRLSGRCALVLVQARSALGAIAIAKSISTIALLGLAKLGHEPVTSTAVQQLATLAFEMLKSEEHNIGHPSQEVRSSIQMVAKVVLTTADTPLASSHSAHLKPYYALTDYGTFGDNLGNLIHAVIARPAGDDDAKRIIGHLSDWSDGIYRGEKKLLLDAVGKQSFLTFDLINWICHVTSVLVAASAAPAASSHDRDELVRNATWLISVLDWLPDDKESVTFVESTQFIEHLFEVTLKMHIKGEDEIAEAARNILLRWAFKAGKHQTGRGSLERAITALCVLAAWKEGSGWMAWLTSEFGNHLAGCQIESEIRERAARELREICENPAHGALVPAEIDYHLARVDHGRLSKSMNAVASLLAPEAG